MSPTLLRARRWGTRAEEVRPANLRGGAAQERRGRGEREGAGLDRVREGTDDGERRAPARPPSGRADLWGSCLRLSRRLPLLERENDKLATTWEPPGAARVVAVDFSQRSYSTEYHGSILRTYHHHQHEPDHRASSRTHEAHAACASPGGVAFAAALRIGRGARAPPRAWP